MCAQTEAQWYVCCSRTDKNFTKIRIERTSNGEKVTRVSGILTACSADLSQINLVNTGMT